MVRSTACPHTLSQLGRAGGLPGEMMLGAGEVTGLGWIWEGRDLWKSSGLWITLLFILSKWASVEGHSGGG